MKVHVMAGLLGSVAIAAITMPATAQEDVQTASEARDISGTDIVVTAQRREERAQDVPVAITAFSQEALSRQNITEPQSLYGRVPSLVVGNQGSPTRDVQSYSIRGQSSGLYSSPAVPVYMAEVPLAAAVSQGIQGAPGQFVDLANVQVLKGPQGTLFGRNTTGGAVLLVPQRPTNNLEGYVQGAVGNYDLRSVEGALNVPVSDTLAVRAAGAFYDRRGFTKDLAFDKWRDDQHWWTGRLSVLFNPSDRFENYLMAYYSKSSNNGGGNVLSAFNLDLLRNFGLCSGPCTLYADAQETARQDGPRRVRYGNDSFSKILNWGITNNTSYELSDELTIRNIFSYQKLKFNYSGDQDGTPIAQYDTPLQSRDGLPTDNIDQWTNELQLQGNLLDNNLTFAVGGFYYNAKPASLWSFGQRLFCPAEFGNSCPQSQQFNNVTNKSKALYAQTTFDFGHLSPSLDSLRLTGGYRYTWDTVRGFSTNYSFVSPTTSRCGSTGVVVPTAAAFDDCRFDATLKSKAPTWTIGLDYKPMRDVMVYGKVSRGYKAGGFNALAVFPSTRTFEPETLTSYEVGFKSDWRLGSMPFRLNANYFYSDYKNIQRPANDTNPATGASGAQILAASARIQGVEVDTSLSPFDGLEIGGNLSYTDGKYKDFSQVARTAQFACNGFVDIGSVADYSCNRFQFVSDWIYSIHVNASIPVAEQTGDLSLLVNYSHVSSQNTTPLSPTFVNGVPVEPGGVLPGYGLLNASLTLADIGRTGVDVTLFATNLTNKTYKIGYSGVYSGVGVWSHLYGEPRMVGVKLRYGFGQ